jgi:preprotein translocase subunit SecA
MKENILDMMSRMIAIAVITWVCPSAKPRAPWIWPAFREMIRTAWTACIFPKYTFKLTEEEIKATSKSQQDFVEMFYDNAALEAYEKKEEESLAPTVDMRELERVIMLRVVDEYWMDHIRRHG